MVCASDMMALGAIRAARQRGLEVPRDVSVVGFDDSPLIAFTDPAADDDPPAGARRWGRPRCARCWRRSAARPAPHSEFVFMPELVVRGSTASVPCGRKREDGNGPDTRPQDDRCDVAGLADCPPMGAPTTRTTYARPAGRRASMGTTDHDGRRERSRRRQPRRPAAVQRTAGSRGGRRIWFEILLIAVSYWIVLPHPQRRARAARPGPATTPTGSGRREHVLGIAVEETINHAVNSVTWLILGDELLLRDAALRRDHRRAGVALPPPSRAATRRPAWSSSPPPASPCSATTSIRSRRPG